MVTNQVVFHDKINNLLSKLQDSEKHKNEKDDDDINEKDIKIASDEIAGRLSTCKTVVKEFDEVINDEDKVNN